MGNGKDPTGGMGRLSRKTRDKVDAELKEEETAVLARTQVDLESLRPRVSDQESFDKLVAAVKVSTTSNENFAELKQRIVDLGEGAVKVAKEVAGILERA